MKHIPVLQSTVLDLLDPKEGETVLDVTVGLGGHAGAFLDRIGPRGKLIGIDADEENVRIANEEMRQYANVQMIHANFRELPSLNLPHCDILFADLGLSSPHLDDPSRGFSFRGKGPLDCRFDRTKGKTAAELLAESREEVLYRIFHDYGELRGAKKLAAHILNVRRKQPVCSTHDLVKVVEEVYGWRAKGLMAQVFQALRIAVNDELEALEALLLHGPALLRPGGRMGIVSYHSLEDRMVKQRFRELTAVTKHPVTSAPLVNGVGLAPRSSFGSGVGFQLLTKKALKPTLQEIEANPRARSARFRAIRKVSS